MRPIPPGTNAQATFVPEVWHTAAAIGNVGVNAVSTPAVLGFLEHTALEAIRVFHEGDEVSVGVHAAIDHVGPAFPGKPVDCSARVIEINGRRVTFEVEATQNGAPVARGRYVRVVVSAQRFDAKESVPLGNGPIEFFFDFHSPWSYLAATRLPAVAARHGREVRWIPIHVARLIGTINGRRPLDENAVFVRWYRQDLQDWAQRTGLEIRYHPAFPIRPARALRAAHRAIESGRGPAFVLRTMKAYWSEARNISDPVVLAEIAASVGLDAQTIRAATEDANCKAAVEEATSVAIAKGVFGVPSFSVDGKLFFGNDRIELLDEQLASTSRASARKG
jgi:2-hydroxychromene-2-carboxylate isomerase/predicted thioesterase